MFKVKTIEYANEIKYMEYDQKYKKIKLHINTKYVNNVKLYNMKKTDEIISDHAKSRISSGSIDDFQDVFNRLSNIIMQYVYDDDNDDDGAAALLLGEVEKLKQRLEIELKNDLKEKVYHDYLEQLVFLQMELNNKLALINYTNSLMEEVNTSSRGR
ncbi:MAG TPA: hypothetical protein PLB45_00960 [Bacilli bacterium]|jgi:hypothetical protein|nr:hypothetical protein [Bacilli bacterium]HPZ23535.1 hypothetical protein [Bacilli bacterium]HQC83430.1 hypothetical protein [Bacilli bacterium]